MNKISVVINTRNEEENLPRAIASVKNLADELIVVDMESTDNTKAIARKLGAKVFNHKLTNYVEPARNFAIKKATNKWVFILDADEQVPPTLVAKLKTLVNVKATHFYRIPRKNIIFGKWIKHSRWWPDQNIRFFQKSAVTWGNIIHSVPTTIGKGGDLLTKEKYAIIHHHITSIDQFVERLNRYTTQHAILKIEDGYRFTWKDLIRRPTNEFLSRYFFGRGYKDGIHGLALAGLQGFSELVMYLKVWQLEGFNEKNIDVNKVVAEMKKSDSEKRYWYADTLVNEKNSKIDIIKRKFRLP